MLQRPSVRLQLYFATLTVGNLKSVLVQYHNKFIHRHQTYKLQYKCNSKLHYNYNTAFCSCIIINKFSNRVIS